MNDKIKPGDVDILNLSEVEITAAGATLVPGYLVAQMLSPFVDAVEEPTKAQSWDKLVAFLSDDSDLTAEQIKEDLVAQGVDVEAFLKRVKAIVGRFKFIPRICKKCHVEHVENCPKCFGFGFDKDGGIITAGDSLDKLFLNWKECDVCRGTPKGRKSS